MAKVSKIDGNTLYIDMTGVKIPSWKIREVQKAGYRWQQEQKKIDPFFSIGYKRRKYKKPIELYVRCEDYFNSKKYVLTNKYGVPKTDPETGEYIYGTMPLTMSGLARHLGVTTSTLNSYEKLAEQGGIPYEFKEILTEAKQRIEEYAETRLYDKDGNKGAEFALSKLFKWRSKLEESMIIKNQVDAEVQKEKWKKTAERMELENKILRNSLEDNEDGTIQVVIEKAQKPLYRSE